MRVAILIQVLAVLAECAVVVLAALVGSRKKKVYGWLIACTFALFVVFDLARVLPVPASETLHALIFLAACGTMLYAVWLMYRE